MPFFLFFLLSSFFLRYDFCSNNDNSKTVQALTFYFSTKQMLITARSFPTTQRLHSFKFSLVNKSHSQQSEAAVRCLGRHFLILYACAHEVSFPDQRPRSLASGQYAWLARSFPPAALGKAYEHHVGKVLPTCSYTKNSLLTALVNCKARMVSCQYDSFLCCSWSVIMTTES